MRRSDDRLNALVVGRGFDTRQNMPMDLTTPRHDVRPHLVASSNMEKDHNFSLRLVLVELLDELEECRGQRCVGLRDDECELVLEVPDTARFFSYLAAGGEKLGFFEAAVHGDDFGLDEGTLVDVVSQLGGEREEGSGFLWCAVSYCVEL